MTWTQEYVPLGSIAIAVATAATGLVGKEGDLFSFTVMHSITLAILVGIMTYLQTYALSWMIP